MHLKVSTTTIDCKLKEANRLLHPRLSTTSPYLLPIASYDIRFSINGCTKCRLPSEVSVICATLKSSNFCAFLFAPFSVRPFRDMTTKLKHVSETLNDLYTTVVKHLFSKLAHNKSKTLKLNVYLPKISLLNQITSYKI